MRVIPFKAGIRQIDTQEYVYLGCKVLSHRGDTQGVGWTQMHEFLEPVLPLTAEDWDHYDTDPATLPKWHKYIQFATIDMMRRGMALRTAKRAEWAADGRTDALGGGQAGETVPPSTIILTEEGWDEADRVLAKFVRARWVQQAVRAQKWA